MKPDRGGLTVGDPAVLRGKTIGVNPDVLQTTEGKAWLAERGIDVTYKDYATGDEVFSALSSGEVDAIIMNDTLSSDDAMPMFYVGESDYYFTVPKSHPDIMAELDAAMTQILTSNPRYPDADIVMCDNTTACFDALSSGRAQAAIIPVTALDFVRSQNDLSTYKTAELPGTVRLTAWMRQDAPTLLAIANKSIANSQDNITAGTYTAQSYGETETTLVRFVRLYQGAFVAGVDVVLVGIMAILAWSLLRARKAQQEAQAASSAKTAFLSRMSHDIRTPLNGIIGMLSVNEAQAEDAEYVSQNRKKARVVADHLLLLINDVLDMSKIEDGKVVLEHKPFSIIDAIDEVLIIGRLRAPEFGVTIESIGAEDLVHTDVIGSPDHVRRARHPQVRKGRCGVGADFRHDGERLCRGCPASPRCRHERASY